MQDWQTSHHQSYFTPLTMVLILLAIFFMRLGFYAADQEKKRSKKVHQQPRNTVKSGRKAG